MTDECDFLKDIAESSFIEGFETALMLLEDACDVALTPPAKLFVKAQRYACCKEYVDGFKGVPSVLTKEIFDEIFNRFCIHGIPYPSAIQVYCELGKKYNLLTDEELELYVAKKNGESND